MKLALAALAAILSMSALSVRADCASGSNFDAEHEKILHCEDTKGAFGGNGTGSGAPDEGAPTDASKPSGSDVTTQNDCAQSVAQASKMCSAMKSTTLAERRSKAACQASVQKRYSACMTGVAKAN